MNIFHYMQLHGDAFIEAIRAERPYSELRPLFSVAGTSVTHNWPNVGDVKSIYPGTKRQALSGKL